MELVQARVGVDKKQQVALACGRTRIWNAVLVEDVGVGVRDGSGCVTRVRGIVVEEVFGLCVGVRKIVVEKLQEVEERRA